MVSWEFRTFQKGGFTSTDSVNTNRFQSGHPSRTQGTDLSLLNSTRRYPCSYAQIKPEILSCLNLALAHEPRSVPDTAGIPSATCATRFVLWAALTGPRFRIRDFNQLLTNRNFNAGKISTARPKNPARVRFCAC